MVGVFCLPAAMAGSPGPAVEDLYKEASAAVVAVGWTRVVLVVVPTPAQLRVVVVVDIVEVVGH
jgi:hypothetical protein